MQLVRVDVLLSERTIIPGRVLICRVIRVAIFDNDTSEAEAKDGDRVDEVKHVSDGIHARSRTHLYIYDII